MNDTHGEQGEGWYGFDLDGTLAKYDGWKGIDHIGEPVRPMVELMKRMHDEGKVVKIMTARVAPKKKPETRPNPYYGHVPDYIPDYIRANVSECKRLYGCEQWPAKMFIVDWCLRNLGFIPEIVYQKDHLMLELYDDRVTEVNAKWYDRANAFLLGMLFGAALVVVGLVMTQRTQPLPEATENLHKAIHEFMESQRRETGDETVR